MIRLGTVVLGADDVDRAVSFWSAVLGYETVRFPEDENEFTILVPPSGEGTRVALQRADTPSQEHPRVHLDLIVDDAAEQAAEITRLVGLGATRVSWDLYPSDPDFVVLADPEGNRFCVVTPATADLWWFRRPGMSADIAGWCGPTALFFTLSATIRCS